MWTSHRARVPWTRLEKAHYWNIGFWMSGWSWSTQASITSFLQRLLHSLTYKPKHLRFCLSLTMTENSYDLSCRSQQTLNCTQAGAHTPCCQVLTELQNTRENTWEVFSIAPSLRVVKGGRWCLLCLLYILPIWDDFLKLVIQLSKWGGEGNKAISSRSQGSLSRGDCSFIYSD